MTKPITALFKKIGTQDKPLKNENVYNHVSSMMAIDMDLKEDEFRGIFEENLLAIVR